MQETESVTDLLESVGVPEASDTELKQVAELVSAYAENDALIAELDAKIKAAKAAKVNYEENLLPAALDQVGLQHLVTTDGLTVEVAEQVHSNVTEARRPDAMQWMKDHGHEGMIKSELSIRYEKGQEALAAECYDMLVEWHAERQTDAMISVLENVHPRTLSAWIKRTYTEFNPEDDDESELPDAEIFGVYRRRVATVTYPAKAKTKRT